MEEIANGFYSAVVGDSTEAEPIRVQDGKWYSIGCADPHDLSSVEILDTLYMPHVPTKSERNEATRWAKLREENYREYARQYRKKWGRDPGHRRWPEPDAPRALGQGEGQ